MAGAMAWAVGLGAVAVGEVVMVEGRWQGGLDGVAARSVALELEGELGWLVMGQEAELDVVLVQGWLVVVVEQVGLALL